MKNQNESQITKPIVAAFDFDGTITTRDSLPFFLRYTSGNIKTLLSLSSHIPQFIACLLKRISRQQVKESLLKSFFKGVSIDTLRLQGKAFATGPLTSILRINAMDELKMHLEKGHRCILISANLDVYLDYFAKEHGFSDCISSKVDFDNNGLITGKLLGLNCIGVEKVKRLNELLGNRDEYILYAYGNSHGDKELLEFADYPFYKKF